MTMSNRRLGHRPITHPAVINQDELMNADLDSVRGCGRGGADAALEAQCIGARVHRMGSSC